MTEEPEADTGKVEIEQAKRRRMHGEWLDRLKTSEADMKPFRDFVRKVDKLYGTAKETTDSEKSPYRIAWANRETIQSAVYQRPPVCVARTRFPAKEPTQRAILRTACEIIERAVNTTVDMQDVHSQLLHARDDLVDYARGMMWVRYEADTERRPVSEDPMIMQALPEDQRETDVITDERVVPDFVTWSDYLHSDARTETEIWWKARRSWMTKDAFKRRFLDYKGQIGETAARSKGSDEDTGPDKTVPVWEIWDREGNEVVFLSPQADEVLEYGPPHLNLEGFFPCPKAAYGTLLKRSMVPKPDVMFYDGQLRQIDKITKRVDALTDALKVRGFYPGGADKDGASAIEAAVKSNDDRSVMIPVPGWAALAGAKGLGIEWLPIDQVVTTLNTLIQQRRNLIEDVYQITGISDIMRGQSQASETARAQEIKTQWGSTRIRSKQGEMQRLAKETCALIAEIIVEHFQPETILKMTQATDPQAQGAIALLKEGKLRPLLIDIETDSTVAADEQADKAARVEFVGMLGQMVEKALPVVQAAPMLVPIFGEAIKFASRGFRIGREMEQTIDDAIEQLVQMASQPAPMAAPPGMTPGQGGQPMPQPQPAPMDPMMPPGPPIGPMQ